MYKVVLSSDAAEVYAAAEKPLARKLARCFLSLESDPRRGNNVRQLKGDWAGYYRFRVGDWRVIYRIDDDAFRVYVAVIAHRREVYE
jgi:mRNA interferase RelE/StbE